jgi:ATPase family associated with various cellular activities (AAA)
MSALEPRDWNAANQRLLVAEIALVKAQLLGGDVAAAAAARDQAQAEMTAESSLDLLTRLFGLSNFERSVVVMCASMELDADLARSAPTTTFGLALASFAEAHWSALTPEAPLRRWGLVELTGSAAPASATLRIDEQILHVLTGIMAADPRVAALLQPVAPAEEVVPSHAAIADEIVALWRDESAGRAPVRLCGEDIHAKRAIAAAAAAACGLKAYQIGADTIPPTAAEAEATILRCEREAVINGGVLLIDAQDEVERPQLASLNRFLTGNRVPRILAMREPVALATPAVTFDVGKPTRDEQEALWRQALPQGAAEPDDLETVLGHFNLDAVQIAAAARLAARAPASPTRLWDACRAAVRASFGDLAQRLRSEATWDSLVVPAATLTALHDMLAHVRQRSRVYREWGMAGASQRGLGVVALFHGPSGTGKTFAAEILANDLRLDLYRIDLSRVVNKYLGETEKALGRILAAAESGGALLLFDEADALFAKRSEVRDSHDRYANVETGYLLQRLESYRGVAILTTNMKSAIDHAFLRRLAFVVSFPPPDYEQRVALWRRAFAPRVPVNGVDVLKLARLTVTGANIRNIAVHAAFSAAARGGEVTMADLRRAAVAECEKIERTPSEVEIGAW